MATEVRDNPERERFEILEDGAVAGFADYRRGGAVITFTHTEVDEALEGHGLGSALVRGALEAARAAGLKVAPVCPFVTAYLRRHTEFHDLVLETFRPSVLR